MQGTLVSSGQAGRHVRYLVQTAALGAALSKRVWVPCKGWTACGVMPTTHQHDHHVGRCMLPQLLQGEKSG